MTQERQADKKQLSYWLDKPGSGGYPALEGDARADVAVLGGGIVGLTTALLLKRLGKSVALVDMSRVGTGVTGHSTAKVTSQHELAYSDIARRRGDEAARAYAEANQAALERIAAFVGEDGIECSFERLPNYVFTESEEYLPEMRREARIAAGVGLPATFLENTPLPFPVKGAVRFEDQAQFDSYAYLLGLASRVDGEGSRVYEDTRALDVTDSRGGGPCTVKTERGTITADDVVIATHIPFPFKGEYWGKASARRAYVIAGAVDPGEVPEGMYINAESPSRSIRYARTKDGETLLLICGEGHKPGQAADTVERYERLEEWSRERFGVTDFRYRWSTQDYWPADGIPFVGKLGVGSRNVWVGTGFSSWGITGGTAAAMILSDLICGLPNPHAWLFDSTRTEVLFETGLYKEGVDVAKRLVGDWVSAPEASDVSEVGIGEGRILRRGPEKVAAYRDEEDKMHVVSAVCTHLGCIVQWNAAEKSWDCPCHASRFSVDGEVLQGPAVKDLGRRNPE